MQNAQKSLDAEAQREVERAAREKAKRGPAKQLATTLINLRDWQIGKPQLSIGVIRTMMTVCTCVSNTFADLKSLL